MKISEDLIVRFFKGQCNWQEAQAVWKYLKEDKGAAERYLGKKEWDDIELSDLLSKERSERMLAKIKSETYDQPVFRIARYKLAVAASLIFMIVTGIVVFKTSTSKHNQIARIEKNDLWRSEKNFSDTTMAFILADGTSIKLEPRSAISYQFPFPADKREVRLTGQGFFKVASDKKRPFTVFSGNISTTALGTEFSIDAFGAKNTVSVKLHEGKVLVRRLNGDEVFYLLPAQELLYDKATGGIVINGSDGAGNSKASQTKHLKMRQTGVSISFDREPLENVFDQLESAYHVNLTYPEDGFKDYYFTGNFNDSDSLERVLRIIAQTNKLEVIKTNLSYKIIKKR